MSEEEGLDGEEIGVGRGLASVDELEGGCVEDEDELVVGEDYLL